MSSLNSITLAQAVYKIFEHTDGDSVWDDFINLCYSACNDYNTWYDESIKAEFTRWEFDDNSFNIFIKYDDGVLECTYGTFEPEEMN